VAQEREGGGDFGVVQSSTQPACSQRLQSGTGKARRSARRTQIRAGAILLEALAAAVRPQKVSEVLQPGGDCKVRGTATTRGREREWEATGFVVCAERIKTDQGRAARRRAPVKKEQRADGACRAHRQGLSPAKRSNGSCALQRDQQRWFGTGQQGLTAQVRLVSQMTARGGYELVLRGTAPANTPQAHKCDGLLEHASRYTQRPPARRACSGAMPFPATGGLQRDLAR